MTPSAQLAEFIKAWEGCRLVPYRDSGGLWTVGVGHLLPQGANPQPWTQEQCDDQLRWDLKSTGMGVQRALTATAWQPEYDAMVSLAFNVGVQAFARSTLLRMFNAGETESAAAQFLAWDHVGGQEVEGLLKRREAERDMFLNGNYGGKP